MFEVDVPDEFSTGGNFLSDPGTYHCLITEIKDGQGPSGKVIQGFTVGLQVLAGTVDGQVDKTCNLVFHAGKLSQKDQGRFANQKIACFAIAADLMDPNLRGKRAGLDLAKAKDRQVIVTLEPSEGSDGKTYLDLSYCNVFHVDDPRAKSFPKNEQALSLIPKELRHDASYFDSLLKKGSQAKSSERKQQPATAGTASDWSDL